MRSIIPIVCGLALSCRVTIATTVNFTEAEGYSPGNIKSHPDWAGSKEGFIVDPSGTGTVAIDDSSSWKNIFYQNSLEAGANSFRASIGFSFKRKDVKSLPKSQNFISIELNQEAPPTTSGIALQLQRSKKSPSRYRLVLKTNFYGYIKFYNSKRFDEKMLGFSSASDENSDHLELRLKLNRGADRLSWTATCTIKNTKKGGEKSFTTGVFVTDAAYFTSELYPVIGSNENENRTLVSERVIEYFTASTTRRETKKKPNVLFLAVDDLNDWTGLWKGHPDALTPNLDRLARMGLRFTNAHCSVPSCNPSRASLLSGMRPATTGLYLNEQLWSNRPRLVKSVPLPKQFRDNGYFTGSTGKIFHKKWPEMWDEEVGNRRIVYPPRSKRPINGLDLPSNTNFDWGPVESSNNQLGDWMSADYVIKKMKENPTKPFFLACGFVKPHLPWYVPQRYFDRFPLKEIDLPVVKKRDLDDVPKAGKAMALQFGDHKTVTLNEGAWREGVQAYLAATSFMDDCLGRILDALEKHPEKDNTIIVLWSDHGWHLGEKMHWRKFALWEEATRVPLIFVVPGMTTPDTETKEPVSLLDIYPTLLDLAGIPANPEAEGHSLAPLLEDWNSRWNHVAVTENGFKNRAVRTRHWRYILYADGSEELYDHRDDPNEFNNLANQTMFEKRKKQLRKLLPKSYLRPPERFVGGIHV